MSTKIFSLISRRAQLPQVVGALMAGLIFGPAVLGELTNALFGIRFCLMPSPLLSRLAELGVKRDSESIAGILKSHGLTSASVEEADIVVINTCSIRENANNKFYGTLGIVKNIKKKLKKNRQRDRKSVV